MNLKNLLIVLGISFFATSFAQACDCELLDADYDKNLFEIRVVVSSHGGGWYAPFKPEVIRANDVVSACAIAQYMKGVSCGPGGVDPADAKRNARRYKTYINPILKANGYPTMP